MALLSFTFPINPGRDADLLRRLKLNNVQAVGELYDRYSGLMYTLLLNIVGEPQRAEDLLAEVFLKVSNLVHDLPDTGAALAPWLLLIARNHALEYRSEAAGLSRRAAYRSALTSPELHQNSNPDWSGVPLRQEAFLRLDQEQRVILELAWFEGLSFADIASKLKRPVHVVRSAAESALSSMRQATKAG